MNESTGDSAGGKCSIPMNVPFFKVSLSICALAQLVAMLIPNWISLYSFYLNETCPWTFQFSPSTILSTLKIIRWNVNGSNA